METQTGQWCLGKLKKKTFTIILNRSILHEMDCLKKEKRKRLKIIIVYNIMYRKINCQPALRSGDWIVLGHVAGNMYRYCRLHKYRIIYWIVLGHVAGNIYRYCRLHKYRIIDLSFTTSRVTRNNAFLKEFLYSDVTK